MKFAAKAETNADVADDTLSPVGRGTMPMTAAVPEILSLLLELGAANATSI